LANREGGEQGVARQAGRLKEKNFALSEEEGGKLEPDDLSNLCIFRRKEGKIPSTRPFDEVGGERRGRRGGGKKRVARYPAAAALSK